MADGGWSGKVNWDGDEVKGVQSVSFSINSESIDISDFDSANTVRTRQRTSGLLDASCTLTCFYDDTDTGQLGLQTDFLAQNGTKEVEFMPDGTNGLEFDGIIESFEVTQDADGIAMMTVTIVADGSTNGPSTKA